ncbi:unnamed protein product [Durusdinium trenchii]|uniref:Aspartyl/asparaginy/proline hydroxylase domain-containing protein n=1 Tax=Durusdinium trenchii TaxID=1381693 RepID=A0ABP0RBV1_9DINO
MCHGVLFLMGVGLADSENDQTIYQCFERGFFSAVQSADCHHENGALECRNIQGGFDEERWQKLISQMWRFIGYAEEFPALAHAVAMSLYSWMWWEGPNNDQVNLVAGRLACDFFAMSLSFNDCGNPALPLQSFFQRNCHMRWRYLLMISFELARHLASTRQLRGATEAFRVATSYWRAMKQLPHFSFIGEVSSPHHISLNADFFPAAVLRQGPVWRSARQELGIVSFLEEHFKVIQEELLRILEDESLFYQLNQLTRNAEPQFSPRDDDWLTAYLVRGAQFHEEVCSLAPGTCALLRSRPEVAQCFSPLSGSGFLRMRPGGRLKPHFGGAPRLSAHLALLVPQGELFMSVGNEQVRWVEGEVIVFDDTFIHSVTHNGQEARYVLNLWMCHPCDPTENHGAADRKIPEFCEGPEQGLLPPALR